MATTSINIRMDSEVKHSFDQFCSELGLTMSTAFNLFAKAALREQRIPFDLALDPYFAGTNMRYIMEGVRAYEQGEPGVVKTLDELEAMANA